MYFSNVSDQKRTQNAIGLNGFVIDTFELAID